MQQATFTIFGQVLKAPRPYYSGPQSQKEFYQMTVTVDEQRPTYYEHGKPITPQAIRSPFTVEAWTQDARAILKRLQLRERETVRISGKLRNKPYHASNGNAYDRITLYLEDAERVEVQDPNATPLPQQTQAQRNFDAQKGGQQ